MSNESKGNSTDVDIKLDQDFDIDYKNDRKTTTDTTTNTHNYNKNVDVKHAYEVEHVHTKGLKLALELETEKTETTNHNTNVNYNSNTTVYEDKFKLDIEKNVNENINVNLTDNWDVNVHVHSENIIQNSHVYSDEDLNDLDLSKLIDVAEHAHVKLDDFNLDVRSVADSFNGGGNDGAINLNQSNNLIDKDEVHDTKASYHNEQAPNVDATLHANGYLYAKEQGDWKADYKSVEHGVEKPDYWKGAHRETVTTTTGWASGWYSAEAAAGAALNVDLTLSAPTAAFETVTAHGGTATAGDGIGHADLNNTNSGNEGDGIVSGEALASADASALAASFNNEIDAGSNQQLNIANVNLVGGDALNAGDIKGVYKGSDGDSDDDAGDDEGGLAIKDSEVELDSDVNDIDTSQLINVRGDLEMDDFDLDIDAIGNSFNGAGNDWAFDVNQANDLIDNDNVTGTYATYQGAGWNAPFQSVTATGGMSMAGDGVSHIGAYHTANENGGDGAILGSTAATADAIASATAFTNSIIVGANVQANSFSATIVGGDQALVDDIM